MIGCLTAPFRLLGCLGLVLVLAVGWGYRDLVLREARGWLEGGASPAAGGPAPSAIAGRPGERALESARSKVDSLNGWSADSVVLTPSELASLVGDGMDRALRRQLDSMRLELLDGEIRVRARLRTGGLPRDAVGPVGFVLRASEPLEATGPLQVVRPLSGEWVVRSIRLRNLPLPADLVPRVVGGVLGEPGRREVPVRLPEGVRNIRVRPGGAILYGATRS